MRIRRVVVLGVFGIISAGSASAQLTADLVAWWPAEGSADDAIGENNGVLQNGASYAPGRVGQAFSFDGVDDFVSIQESPILDFAPGSSYTITCYAYRTSAVLHDAQHVVGKRSNCEGGSDFYQLAIGFNALPESAVPLNTWTFIAVTLDGTNEIIRHFANGMLEYETSGAMSGSNNADLRIGTSGTCEPFPGLVDDVKLYDRALTPEEIAELFNGPAPVPAVAEWGLVVMTLIGLVAGTIMFGRRKASGPSIAERWAGLR